jgi:citrate lyase beta subunit
VQAVLSDDDAKTATQATDMTTLDVSGMASMVSTALGVQQSLDEATSMAVAGWMFGASDQYASWKSDRPRDGEAWDMDGGCMPVDDAPANVS